jgi:UDP-3-O-[3-hydroxymyristoyl] glucosamine N-acyltransferase
MKFSEINEKLSQYITASSLTANKNHDPEITAIVSIEEARNGTLSYIEGGKFASFVATTNATALILPQDENLQALALERGIAWVASKQPRLLFAEAITLFYQPWRPTSEIHPSAVIHPTAKIGEGVYIAAHVVIEANVEIGHGVCIHPNVVIYPDCKIGDRTLLHANCSIHERTRIGCDCVIHSGAVIGDEGFGFVPTTTGWLKMEQSGYVVLEDWVNIGCNSCVDRPAVGETRIGKHTIIDNLVQVGHGCQIGFGCALAGQVGLAGGVKIGNRVVLAGQVGVANQAYVGDGATVSAQAGVIGNIAGGEVVSGTPAIPHKQFLKAAVLTNRLPEIYQTLKDLQRKLSK